MANNSGWVNVGTDHDTTQFAVESTRRQWQHRGRADHPNASRFLISAETGGSTAPAGLGYVRCAEEIMATGTKFDALVLGTGSGGSQAGLLSGFRFSGDRTPVVGFSVAFAEQPQREKVHRLALDTSALLGADRHNSPTMDDVTVDDRFIGPGYGLPTKEMQDALHLLARTEGILLDPVYTGKAMAGLIACTQKEEHGLGHAGDILFLHTGGQPGLFGYRKTITAGH